MIRDLWSSINFSHCFHDEEAEFEPTLFFIYENGPLFIRGYDGLDATVWFYENDLSSVGLVGSVNIGEGCDADDNEFFKGMDKIQTTYDAGLKLGRTLAEWELYLEVLQDGSGEHDGQAVELTLWYQKI